MRARRWSRADCTRSGGWRRVWAAAVVAGELAAVSPPAAGRILSRRAAHEPGFPGRDVAGARRGGDGLSPLPRALVADVADRGAVGSGRARPQDAPPEDVRL